MKEKYNEIYEVLEQLEKTGYISIDREKNLYRYTKKGIFWGNNISALLVEKYLENRS